MKDLHTKLVLTEQFFLKKIYIISLSISSVNVKRSQYLEQKKNEKFTMHNHFIHNENIIDLKDENNTIINLLFQLYISFSFVFLIFIMLKLASTVFSGIFYRKMTT